MIGRIIKILALLLDFLESAQRKGQVDKLEKAKDESLAERDQRKLESALSGDGDSAGPTVHVYDGMYKRPRTRVTAGDLVDRQRESEPLPGDKPSGGGSDPASGK